MKDGKQVTEILEAFDLTGSFRAASELAGCSPNTVADWVAKRDRGELGDLAEPLRRERKLDEFLPKIEEWVDRSNGRVRADVCHEKLEALGYDGSDRTVRRAVAEVKAAFRCWSAAGVSALDRGAGHVGPVGLGSRARGSAAGR